ncbi:hypothetical protein NPIL_110591 [Nephila pilipes]|uniref:Uncharacterized protein n=1 Tax=Nephila pilipes TaxID=299642 RepID=A0A8X6ISB2_NEPPI|nr:hypothetical protein NPIL_110591 [Nephila pilipes]
MPGHLHKSWVNHTGGIIVTSVNTGKQARNHQSESSTPPRFRIDTIRMPICTYSSDLHWQIGDGFHINRQTSKVHPTFILTVTQTKAHLDILNSIVLPTVATASRLSILILTNCSPTLTERPENWWYADMGVTCIKLSC